MSSIDELWQINNRLSLVTTYEVRSCYKSEIIVTHVTIMALALGLLKMKKNPLHCAVYLDNTAPNIPDMVYVKRKSPLK